MSKERADDQGIVLGTAVPADHSLQPSPSDAPVIPRVRDEKLLRDTVSMLANFVWTKKLRQGEHMWSIPADQERDFDCILIDAIDELVALRSGRAALTVEVERLQQECADWRQSFEASNHHVGVLQAEIEQLRHVNEELSNRSDLMRRL